MVSEAQLLRSRSSAEMNIRCRGPAGSSTLTGLESTTTVLELQRLLAEKTGVPVETQEILSGGFPPAVIKLPEDPASATLSSIGLQGGDSITVRAAAVPTPAPTPEAAAPQPLASAPSAADVPASLAAPSPGAGNGGFSQQMIEDEELARAIALSMGAAQDGNAGGPTQAAPASVQLPSASSAAAPSPATSSAQQVAPSSIALSSGSAITRRIIDSDNSCLFNAVGYVVERSRAKSAQLRSVIANAVAADPTEFNEGVLGKPAEEYCQWIRKPNTWGGAIELSILSKHFEKEIAAYDIQTKRCDVYGEGNGYDERVMVIYDGLHYDAMAMAAFEGAPEELDMTIFRRGSLQLHEADEGARKLVERCHAARQFTDTGNFTLRCGTCQIGVKGEKEATEHAKATGHTNFSEYH
mmetsp:Transcript_4602/g.12813  ORF Transcript_4602/g.12813 Transcript_4602/m.12813 type:complete len:411 (-) Transcript_4602:78-1310(-)